MAASVVSREEFQEWGELDLSQSAEQNRADLCLATATVTFERMCGRRFSKVTEAREVEVPVNSREVLLGDFQSLTLVETLSDRGEDWVVVPATEYRPVRLAQGRPYRLIRRTGRARYFPQGMLRATGEWGMDVPDDIKIGVMQEAFFYFQSNQAPGGEGSDYEGNTVEEFRARNPVIYSVVDNWAIGVAS